MFFTRNTLPSTGDQVADRLLQIISDRVGVTGWEIARAVSAPPSDIEVKLKELLDKDLIKSEGNGLDAYYAPSRQLGRLRISGSM